MDKVSADALEATRSANRTSKLAASIAVFGGVLSLVSTIWSVTYTVHSDQRKNDTEFRRNQQIEVVTKISARQGEFRSAVDTYYSHSYPYVTTGGKVASQENVPLLPRLRKDQENSSDLLGKFQALSGDVALYFSVTTKADFDELVGIDGMVLENTTNAANSCLDGVTKSCTATLDKQESLDGLIQAQLDKLLADFRRELRI